MNPILPRDREKNSYYEDRIKEMSGGGSVDLTPYVTLSYLQTGYDDKTKVQDNLNNAISNLSSVYSTKTETNTAISNLSSIYAPIGSGSGNTNI